MQIFRPIWAEINCDNLVHNLKIVRETVGSGVKVMAVVKADAYGHGAGAVTRVLSNAGADAFGVASLEEAIELREAGIKNEIIVLGYTQTTWASAVVEHDIRQTIYHQNLAMALAREAADRNGKAKIHIKVDTGMGRVGISPENAVPFISSLAGLPGLAIEGIFTHFSCADILDEDYTREQLTRFSVLISELEKTGLKIPVRHAANSAGTLHFPASHLDMVRTGIMLYGLFPSELLKSHQIDLRPVMSIKSLVVELKTVPPGSRVSYGGTFTTKRTSRIATLPVGYADGFSRRLSNTGSALIAGRRAHIVGNVCMDFLMVDVTDIPDVKVNDEAILIGRQGCEEITVDEIAAQLGTINYEVVTLIGKRVPRIYTHYSTGNPLDIGKKEEKK